MSREKRHQDEQAEQQTTAAPEPEQQAEQSAAAEPDQDSSSDEPQVGRRPDFVGTEGEEGSA